MMKSFRFIFIFLVFSLLSATFSVQAQEVLRYNIQECIQSALRNNEDIKESHYDILSSMAKKVEATKRYVPVVKYKYRFAPVPQDLNNPYESVIDGQLSVMNSISLEVGVPVSTFGRLTVAKELADIGIDASLLQKQRKADEIILDIHKLYYGILLARELTVLANKGLEAINNKITELEKEETTDQLQVLKLKAIFYQVEKRLDEANKKGSIALTMLKYRLGLEDDVNFDLKDKSLQRVHFKMQSFEELLAISKAQRPEFKLLSFNVQAKQKQLTLERKEYLPKLVFGSFLDYGVSPGISGDEDENNFTNPFNFFKAGVGFELSGELDFRKIKSKVDLAKSELLKSIAQKRSKYRLMEIDLKDAYLDLIQKNKLLWRAEKEQRSARQIVFLTKSNLDIGLGEKKDYLEALQSYLLIQAAVYENIFNYNVAVVNLKQRLGVLYKEQSLE